MLHDILLASIFLAMVVAPALITMRHHEGEEKE